MVGVEVLPQKEKFTRVPSFLILCMAMGYSNGLTDVFTMAVSREERSTGKDSIFGLMGRYTMGNSKRTTVAGSVFSTILTVKDSREHGKTERSMAKATTCGQRVRSTTASTSTAIRKTRAALTIPRYRWTSSNVATVISRKEPKQRKRQLEQTTNDSYF